MKKQLFVWTILLLFWALKDSMGASEVISREKSITLPEPSFQGQVSVEKAIKQRRTIRNFQEKPLKLSQLS